MSFKVNDLRQKAKVTSTHLTPDKVCKWFANQVGSSDIVFDPAVGSGQLFQFLEAKKFIGNDIDFESIEYFKGNFKNVDSYVGNYLELENIEYDVAISNYPFSLKSKDIYVDNVENNAIKNMFFKKDVTGKADWFFILKSFLNSKDKKGYYLCSPGIGYRQDELKFRSFLLENNFVKRYGILKNCDFDATNIPVFYLELSLNFGDIETFLYDFKTEKYEVVKSVTKEDIKDIFETPEINKVVEEIDIVALEKEIKIMKNKRRRTEDKLDKFIAETFHKKEEESTKQLTLF